MCSTIKNFDFKLTFAHHCHALVSLYVQFLYSDWSKFDRWVHAENLCSILKVVYFDRVLCQLVMFLTVFFHWMYKNEIQLLSGVFCYPWSRVCLMGFWLRHTSLGKVGNPISPCLMRKQFGISLNLRTGSTGHATLFNQWEGALVFIKTSTQWSKILTPVDGVGQILR